MCVPRSVPILHDTDFAGSEGRLTCNCRDNFLSHRTLVTLPVTAPIRLTKVKTGKVSGPWRALDKAMIDPTTTQLAHYMDLLSASQKLVTSNMANADTPGYKTQDIDFQFEFMSMVEGQPPQTINPQGLVTKSDGNNVSLDREARLLSENAMRFNVASTLVRGQLKIIRSAIDEGKSG
jgi:flagellar basal-body rod protein FlgB